MVLAINDGLNGISNPAVAAALTKFLRVIFEIDLLMAMPLEVSV
jgi:hypothetical protein